VNRSLGVAAFVLYIAVAFILVRRYRGTGDKGFLLLGLPLVISPLVALPLAMWLQTGVDRLIAGREVNSFPFTLVQQGRLSMGALLTVLNLVQHVIWGVSSLMAVLVLKGGRERS
jgi:hypothetical protein